MHDVLITGAGGYVGSALAARLSEQLRAGRLRSLTVTDLDFGRDRFPSDMHGLHCVEGDLADADVLKRATATQPDHVFHLAGITSRRAEQDPGLALRVNVSATSALCERLRGQEHVPSLLYASSIAVHGTPLPKLVDDSTPPSPALIYGIHKRMMELLLGAYARRSWIDARIVRLPGIVARPVQSGAALSAFAGDLMHAVAQGRSFTCPVGSDATVWLLSLPTCVDNLVRTMQVPNDPLFATGQAWHLPALRVRIGDLVDALAQRFGADAASGIVYDPQPELEAQFAKWPPLQADTAKRLGLFDDGDLDGLVSLALT